ncbi:MAG: VPLPA-CTERM sorting domain-containing protein, partial [Pseudomonadota bacterium]|nr:VPLPA-CTERM sorting domain-containing protein [Pseudomonadota bacterium]
AGQGLSPDVWGNFSGTARFGNERVAAVVAVLAGFLADDRPGIGADIQLLSTCSPVSSVPLPPSLWFLFSGLGLLGVARRRW